MPTIKSQIPTVLNAVRRWLPIPVSVVRGPDWSLPVAGGVRELGYGTLSSSQLTAASLNADLVPSIEVAEFKSWSLQITGTWAGTFTFQGSNDGTNFVSVIGYSIADTTKAAVTTTTANGLFVGPVYYKYLRVRKTAHSSHTSNGGFLVLSGLPLSLA